VTGAEIRKLHVGKNATVLLCRCRETHYGVIAAAPRELDECAARSVYRNSNLDRDQNVSRLDRRRIERLEK